MLLGLNYTAVNQCIYCRSELPDSVPREHIIPRSFGVFTPDLTLRCVCSACNGHFGSKLEWPMLSQSIEGMRRLQFGHKGRIGGIGTKGIAPVVGEGDDWKGARTSIRTNDNGMESTEVLPQIGARSNPSEPFEWILERELNADFAARHPRGSEFRIVGGQTSADNERLVNKLIEVCPSFVYAGTMNPEFSTDGRVMLSVEYQMTQVVARCLCKIGFNYMALTCGQTFVLSSEFDGMRAFIRNNVGDGAGRVFVKEKPIIAQEIVSGERGTDGHVLTIEGRPSEQILEVQLSLFNTIPYRIPMSRNYMGHEFAKGNHFSQETGEASELTTFYAGADFDPSQIRW